MPPLFVVDHWGGGSNKLGAGETLTRVPVVIVWGHGTMVVQRLRWLRSSIRRATLIASAKECGCLILTSSRTLSHSPAIKHPTRKDSGSPSTLCKKIQTSPDMLSQRSSALTESKPSRDSQSLWTWNIVGQLLWILSKPPILETWWTNNAIVGLDLPNEKMTMRLVASVEHFWIQNIVWLCKSILAVLLH